MGPGDIYTPGPAVDRAGSWLSRLGSSTAVAFVYRVIAKNNTARRHKARNMKPPLCMCNRGRGMPGEWLLLRQGLLESRAMSNEARVVMVHVGETATKRAVFVIINTACRPDLLSKAGLRKALGQSRPW